MLACGRPEAQEDATLDLAALVQGAFGGDLGQVVGMPVATGRTCGKTSDYQPSCAVGPAAPDVAYLWRAPSSDRYTFSTVNSNFDTVLEVRPYNNTTQSLGCNDDIGPGQQQSSLEIDLTSGQVVQVIVDSYGSKCGDYQLNIFNSGGNCPVCHTGLTGDPANAGKAPGASPRSGSCPREAPAMPRR
ncbi:Muc19 precursor [Myxococcus hansupus]|uniref:Muc19 n=1 Tax=Pseudomyxococcus hansupus TaxID=1297742 RepID=A0A0H4XJ69_9BACT|nr:Muc19 precursor [Myxococcus hansupus]